MGGGDEWRCFIVAARVRHTTISLFMFEIGILLLLQNVAPLVVAGLSWWKVSAVARWLPPVHPGGG